MKSIITFLFIVLSAPAFAINQEEMVQEIKKFILHVEEEGTFHDIISSKSNLNFISEAWASDLDCFYGGWPSSLVKQGNRKYCSHPKNSSPHYNKSACKTGETSCQPLLFGEGLCVPASSAQQRQSTFKYCENAFQKKGASYDFVNQWDNEKKNEFNQLLSLAHKICVSGETGIQKYSGMCKSFMSKMGHFQTEKSISPKSITGSGGEVCAEVSSEVLVSQKSITVLDELSRKIASEEKMKSVDPHAAYRALKLDFETSPYCDPISQYDDKSKQHMFFSGLAIRLRSLQPSKLEYHLSSIYNEVVGELVTHFNLDESLMPDLSRTLNQLKNSKQGSQEFLTQSRAVQAILMDQIYNQIKAKPILKDRYIQLALQDAGVIELDDQDNVVCPFVDEETFVKAFTGYEKLEGKLKKPILTIVDYTKPSNQRRMFIFDMKKGLTLGNTWVSHGMGDGSQIQGIDGKGSSPKVSNVNKSQLSSAGFIMTAEASYGSEWGNNIILKGLEKQNSNIQRRAIIMHAFRTQPLPTSLDDPEFSLFERWEKAKSMKEKADMVWEFRTLNVRPFIDATYGCLGVAKHPTVDRESGKTVDQLEYLRSKISNGSLIYSHASEDQESEFY